jgi:cytochrome d ubiquinol oxidase subunit I
MIPVDEIVNLSRLQFAVTAMFHFLFAPLSLGLGWMLLIMESVYVMSGLTIYRDMTRFWGKLFGINFALGVATGLPLEFQFGTNWSYFSHYVGDIFGTPLAIEGMLAFFLESTFIGLFFFGWERLSKVQHLVVTLLVALGANLSALWILVANGWMSNPVGASFNPDTLRIELASFGDVLLNPVAQVKFVHTVAAAYVTSSMFVLGISSWYLLRQRHLAFALRSFAVAAGFGLASALSVIVLGDASGYTVGEVNQTKLAAIEAEWETQPAPAPLTVFGIPDEQRQHTDYALKIPYLLGLLATHSTDEKITGIKELKHASEARIRNGMRAYAALQRIQSGDRSPGATSAFKVWQEDLGYGLLLKKYTPDVANASEAQIQRAVDDTVPRIAPLFWAFRIMVGLGGLMLFIFIAAFWQLVRQRVAARRWLLTLALWSIPLPWIAAELGWFVAEYGRQPWAISETLPTQLAASVQPAGSLYASLAAFIALYALLLFADIGLIVKQVRQGPQPALE